MLKRLCSYCNKEKPLNKKHFQLVKTFKQGYSFCCLICNEQSKKPRKKDQKFLNEKLEVKIQHRDLKELVKILGYYKGMIESSEEHEIPTSNIDRILTKIKHELNKHT
jgi:ribosome-associated translation inhibitor RaiA